jgi:ribosome-binding factor A
MTAYVCVIEVHLHLSDSHDLKGKRKVLHSLKAQLRQRFGAAVAETDGQDTWQRTTLVCALVGDCEVQRRADMAERMRRVNELMREVIGSAISAELEDPRIGFVTVTSVETSPDLRSARVYVSVLGGPGERQATLAGLRSSHGVLQAAVARQVRLKRTPTLSFHYDDTPERGVRLSRLLEHE